MIVVIALDLVSVILALVLAVVVILLVLVRVLCEQIGGATMENMETKSIFFGR